MAAATATAVKAIAAAATDKRTWKVIAVIIGAIAVLFCLPLIVYMGVMSNLGEIEIDTVQVQESIVQNMSAEEKAKLSHLESVMNNIQTEFQSREFNNYTIKKAQAIYACAFYDAEKSDNDFISKFADCFENANDDYELLELLNSTFGTDISQDDFNNLVSVIKNTVIDIDFSSTDKNNLDFITKNVPTSC